ncbi:unnamed protein product [Caenorhabditis angaria]|uniref:Peroxisomal biogenesis factor 3 n=1 Tax=Caenorhabditis angaria TaxID=860376 RepID=A0A9P1J1K4_9PELO|nr:unnamed protein product [Caenorhabditis angaria]
MFSAAWEFTKRHKGKIITGGVLVGSAIAYATSRPTLKNLETAHAHEELPNQARRHYIFDSTHRSCDQSITDLIPSITSQIEGRFEVDSIREKLNAPDLPIDQKIQLWDLLKRNVFCRIIAVAYCFSILTLTLKAQISILAADTCLQFEKRKTQSDWKSYLPESLSSLIPNTPQPAQNSSMEVGNRRIFLQCVQYFTLRGVPQLMESIHEAVSEELKDWQLKDVKSKYDVRLIFDKIGTRVGTHGLLTKLVAPIENNGMDMNSSVVKLLQKLTSNLESDKSINTLNSLLDFYFSASLKMVDSEEQAIVKYIPSLSNAYPILTSTSFDSPLFNSLYSSDVHQFAVYVFNS